MHNSGIKIVRTKGGMIWVCDTTFVTCFAVKLTSLPPYIQNSRALVRKWNHIDLKMVVCKLLGWSDGPFLRTNFWIRLLSTYCGRGPWFIQNSILFCFAVWFGPCAIKDRSFLSLSFGVGVVSHPALSRLKRLQDLEEEEDENVRHVKNIQTSTICTRRRRRAQENSFLDATHTLRCQVPIYTGSIF